MATETNFEKLKLPYKDEKGTSHHIPALDPRWCENRAFPKFFALKSAEKVLVESWCSNMLTLVLRCKWLLQLPHHKFWSFVVYGDKSFDEMLDSYLVNCPRYTEPTLINMSFFSTKQKISEFAHTLHRRIFLIFLRMSSRRETEYVMSSDFFGSLIYDNDLFTIPRIMDLCALYGQDNERLLLKMLEHIFKCQPKYYGDMKENGETLLSLFEKCEKTVASKKCQEMSLLVSRPSRYDDRITFDAVYYLVDVAYSLSALLKFCPNAYELHHESGITNRLPSLFENTVPILLPAINAIEGVRFNEDKNMMGRLSYIEKTIIKLFRDLVCQNSLNYLLGLKETSKKSVQECLDDFFESMTSAVHEKHFAAVYNMHYPFAEDVKSLKGKKHEMYADPERLNYFMDAFPVIPDPNKPLPPENKQQLVPQQSGAATATATATATASATAEGSSKSVNEIREIFPELAEDVIKHYLSFYDGSVEKVVNALLTDSLPPELSAKQNIDNVPPGFEAISSERPSKRTDDDEYASEYRRIQAEDEDSDVYLMPLTSSKKRGLKDHLEDKPSVECSRAIYDRYQYETPADDEYEGQTSDGAVSLTGGAFKNINIYEDEYDDTYDGHNINVEGDAGSDEVLASFLKSKSKDDKEEAEEAPSEVPAPENNASGRNWKGNYTGGRERQNKERHKKSHKHQALYKHSRGMGFY